MVRDFYEILGVSKDAADDQIKKAYRKLARKWHPDFNPEDKEAEQKFKEVSMAYDVLGKPEKRKLYDEFGQESLQSGFNPQKAREYKKWRGFQQKRKESAQSAHDFGSEENYEDVFNDIFGGTENFRYDYQDFYGQEVSKGRDVEYEMEIDLVSALKGAETEIALQKQKPCARCDGAGIDPSAQEGICLDCGGTGRVNVSRGPVSFSRVCPKCSGKGKIGKPCYECNGNGMVSYTERIRVSIPPGVKEGARVRVAGKGESGLGGGRAGDLFLIIHIRPHPFLRREGDDLYMEVPVTVGEAIAGGTVKIPTIGGHVNLKIPPQSQSGQTLKLKGKGAVNSKTKKRGNLLVKLIVKVPKTKNAEVLDSVKKMEKYYGEDVRAGIRL